MARTSNKQIVEELKEGNPSGCRHLVELYQERLIGDTVSVFDVAQEDAEELVNDVLLTVVEKIQSFSFKRGEGDFHNWVMTIFRNRVRDFVRHQAIAGGLEELFQESSDDDDEVRYSGTEREVIAEVVRRYQDSLREVESTSDATEGGDRLRVVAETLEQMESWERVLLRCRALDVPYEEIATYTGKPVKQLKVYHARVKKKFVKMLAQHFPELTHQKPECVANET